jgi:hypothetical protein
MVHQHLDGSVSLTHGPCLLGSYTPEGVVQAKTPARDELWKTRGGKVKKPTFPTRLKIPHTLLDSHSLDGCWLTQNRTF